MENRPHRCGKTGDVPLGDEIGAAAGARLAVVLLGEPAEAETCGKFEVCTEPGTPPRAAPRRAESHRRRAARRREQRRRPPGSSGS